MQRIPVMLLSIGAILALASAVKVATAPEVNSSENTGFFSSIGDFFVELWQLVCLHALVASVFFTTLAVLCSIYGMSVLRIGARGLAAFGGYFRKFSIVERVNERPDGSLVPVEPDSKTPGSGGFFGGGGAASKKKGA